jgi:hypothetical protein
MTIHPEYLGEITEDVVTLPHPEHARAPAVVRVVEMVGVSEESWSDAARQIVARAAQKFRHVTGLEVLRTSAVVCDGKIVEYRLTARLAFIVEPAEIET